MKKVIKSLIKAAFITSLVFLSSCNKSNEDFVSKNSLIYNYDAKAEPAYAEIIDLDEAYESGWSIKIFERNNKSNESDKKETYFKEINQNYYFNESINYIYKKLIVYQDNYFAIVYKSLFKESPRMEEIIVKQFYGSNYKFELIGVKNDNYIAEQKDINFKSLYLFELAEKWYLEINEYDSADDKTIRLNSFSGKFDTNQYSDGWLDYDPKEEVHFTYFYLRRAIQDNYFALNYRQEGKEKHIVEYLNNNEPNKEYSYYFSYKTTRESLVF